MLSYRHGFHAGSPADLLKQLVLVLVIEHLGKKDKGFCVHETHAGAGLYDLEDGMALRNAEFRQGIGLLWEGRRNSPLPAAWWAILEGLNPDGRLRFFPGSPEIARRLLRAQDHLVLMELHRVEVENLRERCGRDARVSIMHRDGYEGIVPLLPPTLRRGLVFMDPSYEVGEDYDRVPETLARARARWERGIFIVWYPLLGKRRDRSAELLGRLAAGNGDAGNGDALLAVEMETRPQAEEYGMHGSGMAIVNPPWNLDRRLGELLPRLTEALGPGCGFRLLRPGIR